MTSASLSGISAWLPNDAHFSGASFSCASSPEGEKKSPALTFSQSKILMQGVLGLPEVDFKLALEIVLYYQQRNYAAYCSHRKRALKSLKRLGDKPR